MGNTNSLNEDFDSLLPSKQKPTKAEISVARKIREKDRDDDFCSKYAYFSGNDDYLDIDEEDSDSKESFFY